MQTSKSEMISFRVTKEDKDLLRKNCQAAGYGENLSKYLLEKGKEQSVPYAKIQRAKVKYLYREIEFFKTLDEKISDAELEAHMMIQKKTEEVNQIWLGC